MLFTQPMSHSIVHQCFMLVRAYRRVLLPLDAGVVRDAAHVLLVLWRDVGRAVDPAKVLGSLPVYALFILSGLLGLFGIRRLAHR